MTTETPSSAATRTFVARAGAELVFDEKGEGPPVVALHGAYSTRHEIRSVLEPSLATLDSHRRLYPDLPGMGDTQPHDSVRTSNDVVDLLDEFVHAEIGDTLESLRAIQLRSLAD